LEERNDAPKFGYNIGLQPAGVVVLDESTQPSVSHVSNRPDREPFFSLDIELRSRAIQEQPS
jgi:hypothetical protein